VWIKLITKMRSSYNAMQGGSRYSHQ